MARPAKFTSEQIIDSAAALVAEGGPAGATMASIAQRLGGPTGSIYHRFESRDLLLAMVWIRTARRAQAGFVDALAEEDVDRAAIEGALHIPRWARSHLQEAQILLLHRREDLAKRWPTELGDELEALGRQIEAALRQFTRRLNGRLTKTGLQASAFALVDVPYAAVRRYLLAGKAPPRSVDHLVRETCRHLLLGEAPQTVRSGTMG